MSLIRTLLLGLCLAGAVPAAAADPPPAEDDGGRIFYGKTASWDTAPWQLRLRWQDGAERFGCGAALISREWALTARHCVVYEGAPFDEATAIAAITISGRHLTEAPGDTPGALVSRVDRVIPHPGWQVIAFNFKVGDIALLHLAQPFDPRPTPAGAVMSPKPVGLPGNDPGFPAGGPFATGLVAGWGQTESQSYSDSLQFAELQILTPAQCSDKAVPNRTGVAIPLSLLCAQAPVADPNKPTVTCAGDSGGPLVMTDPARGRKIIVGLVSAGVGCSTNPITFTRISHYVDWIRETTGIGRSATR